MSIYPIEEPRRVKRLPQMSKRNRRLSRKSKSEFLLWAPMWDLKLQQKAAHARGT